jgi:hypothetical protein
MKPSQEALGFRCDNKFFGNVSNDSRGAVNTTRSDRWSSSAIPESQGTSTSIATSIQHFIGAPALEKPDISLYLNLECPHDYEPSTKDLVFAGRINGELVGFTGIYDTLVTLVSSLMICRNPCPGHDQRAHCLNVKSSAWMAQRYRKPMDGLLNYHTYIPVEGDGCWAILLAGQAGEIGGRVCFGCFDCLLLADGRHPTSPEPASDDDCFPRLYIGYQ